jgi:hypothetical protein
MLKRYHTKIYFPKEFLEDVRAFLEQRKPFHLTKHALEKISHYSNLKQGQILEIVGEINSGSLEEYECFEVYKGMNGLEKVAIRVPFDGRYAVFVLARNGVIVTFYTCADDHNTLNTTLYEVS